MKINVSDLNWKDIQAFYDDSNGWREVCDRFKISFNILSEAQKAGLFKSRTVSETSKLMRRKRPPFHHTKETKQKLSIARKAYLAANPDKCSWKSVDKFKSVPCEKIKNELAKLNISFIEELQPLLHKNRFYSADIAFEQWGVIWEINGAQHFDSDGNLKPYYQERHDLIEKEGWRIFEIPYHVAMRDGIVEELLAKSKDLNFKPSFEYKLYKKNAPKYCKCGKEIWPESIKCKSCSRKTPLLSFIEKCALHQMVWLDGASQTAKIFGILPNSIKKRCIKNGISFPPLGYAAKLKAGLITDYQI